MTWNEFLESRQSRIDAGDRDGSPDYLTDLSHLALLDVRGEDAPDFLHAQLTLNVHGLVERHAALTAWCNPKGRVLASLLLYRLADAFGLLLSADLADAIGKRLRMFVLRSRVQIAAVSDTQPCFGACGDRAAAGLAQVCNAVPAAPWQVCRHDDVVLLRLPPDNPPRYLVTGPIDALTGIWGSLESACRPAERNRWLRADIEAGLPWISAATSEAFLPQMLDLDRFGGLVHDKGCYPGQEVIARLHYRGEVKQRLRRGGTRAAPPEPGTALYGPDGERRGTVVTAAAVADGSRLLAVAVPGYERLHIAAASGDALDLEPDPWQ